MKKSEKRTIYLTRASDAAIVELARITRQDLSSVVDDLIRCHAYEYLKHKQEQDRNKLRFATDSGFAPVSSVS